MWKIVTSHPGELADALKANTNVFNLNLFKPTVTLDDTGIQTLLDYLASNVSTDKFKGIVAQQARATWIRAFFLRAPANCIHASRRMLPEFPKYIYRARDSLFILC